MTNTILTLLSASRLKEHYTSGFWRDETIYSLAAAHARRTPDRFAFRDQYRRVTYLELQAAADRLAADMRQAGIRKGQRVAVWLPSRLEVAIALLACSRNGYICCPSLHRNHTVGEVVELMERMRAAALVAETGYGADADRHDVFSASSSLPSLRKVYRLEPLGPDNIPTEPFAGLFAEEAGMADPGPIDQSPNDVVYLAFTSGTTGAPKGVMHSDNTLLANARAINGDWGLNAETITYTLSPLSHNLGLGALIASIAVGGELVVHDLPKGRSLLERLIETGSNFIYGVPVHAIDLLRELREHGSSGLGKIKGFRISGAAAPSEVIAELLQYGITPQSGYGMTEACSHHYTLPNDDPKMIIETSGRACPGYEIRIWSQDNPDIEVPPGQIGQIGGWGASLMLGYFDDQTANEDSFNAHGWFMTGDLGWVDENGYLRITGRKKDVIIRGGHNIYPARIEALAMRHPKVERVAALPVPDERLGEKVCLAVMPRKGCSIDPEELLAHLDAAGLSKFDMPEYFLELEEIPLTPSGKVLKRDLVTRVEEGRVAPVPVRWRPKPQSVDTTTSQQVTS